MPQFLGGDMCMTDPQFHHLNKRHFSPTPPGAGEKPNQKKKIRKKKNIISSFTIYRTKSHLDKH